MLCTMTYARDSLRLPGTFHCVSRRVRLALLWGERIDYRVARFSIVGSGAKIGFTNWPASSARRSEAMR